MIHLFCPSRGRPQAARELLDNFNSTKTLPDTRLFFVVDHDDPTQWDYPRIDFADGKSFEPTIHGAPTGDPVGPLNREALKSSADIVGYIGDDSRFETQGWDARVEKAIDEAGGAWVWCSDGHDKPWPSTIFVSTDIVKALGWLALPTTKRGYFDVVWVNLAMVIGRAISLPDVMIRHDNAGEGVNPGIIEQDRLAYESWRKGKLPKDAASIRAFYRSRLRAVEEQR